MSPWPLSLRIYGLAMRLAEPLAPWLLRQRARRGKEDGARLSERLGRASLPRPDGDLVWVHAASVGESLSHLPLVERLIRERPDLTVLATSGTRTSAELLARRLPPGVLHQYAPIDTPGAAARFLAHWRPSLGLVVESELWPNLLHAAKARGVRLALLGARISGRSARAWDRRPAAAGAVLGLFDLIFAQDLQTGDWIQTHGAKLAGRLDLKRLAAPLPADEAELASLRQAFAGRRLLLAASTHPGEEALIAEAAGAIEPRPLLVVVPRHPERGAEAAQVLQAHGWRVARRSRDEPLTPETGAYVADTLGELGLFYRLADVVALGGGFVPGPAGHNPLEPARFGKAVITGPHHDSFRQVYAELLAGDAAMIVNDDTELAMAMNALLHDPLRADGMGRRAKAVADQGHGDLEDAWPQLQALLPPP